MRDDRPADGADGGGKALWATGADVDAVEVLAFIVQIVQNRKLQVFFLQFSNALRFVPTPFNLTSYSSEDKNNVKPTIVHLQKGFSILESRSRWG